MHTVAASDVSAYEQQRLDNIARNNAVLVALGLQPGTCAPPAPAPKKPKPGPDAAPVVLEPSRRSSRVSQKPPLYAGLSDEYFVSEEREEHKAERAVARAVDRPRRCVGSGTTFAEEFGYSADSLVREHRKRKEPSQLAPPVAPSPLAMVPSVPPGLIPAMQAAFAARTGSDGASVTSRGSCRVPCPRCGERFALRSDGRTMQKHDPCGSVRIY